jgi:hypothetical protein
LNLRNQQPYNHGNKYIENNVAVEKCGGLPLQWLATSYSFRACSMNGSYCPDCLPNNKDGGNQQKRSRYSKQMVILIDDRAQFAEPK